MKVIKLDSLNLDCSEITSASSLINIEGRVFVCCDDQYSLYELNSNQKWIEYIWQQAPQLPTDSYKRKKLKPDFEALIGPILDGNAIMLVPSGSKMNRTTALRFDLETHNFTSFDLSSFFTKLSENVGNMNIEGAAIWKNHYLLMNRGVGDDSSSMIQVNIENFSIVSIVSIDFGEMAGIKLHGSEICVFEDDLYVAAVAEDTNNSYDDGKVSGSALFRISPDSFAIIDQWAFDQPVKIEGLCRWENKWMASTDPDGIGRSLFFSFSL